MNSSISWSRPPFIYYGGKTTIAKKIVDLLPEHKHYVEPFAGSLAVLLAKPPSRMETVNDLDADLMTFWRTLRDRPAELERVCTLTPHARAEHSAAYRPADDELEQARRVWVKLTQGRTGTLRRTGWRNYVAPGQSATSLPGYLVGYRSRLAVVSDRLMRVSLECRPAMDVITTYGAHRDVLLYVDPPYLGSVRCRNYRHEMLTETKHRELAAALTGCRATVVLSGYDHPLYAELYNDWDRTEIAAHSGQARRSRARTEVLWCNRPLRTPDRDIALFAGTGVCNETPADAGECNETRCGAPDCRKVLRQPTTGRRRTFCSTACRVRNHRRSSVATLATVQVVPLGDS